MAHIRPPLADARRALAVSVTSLVWTLLASAVACALGVIANSLVLLAFGGIGLIDGAGSIALVIHFRHTVRHEVPSERHERAALTVVTVGLFVFGLSAGAESVHRLVTGDRTSGLIAGVVLAGLSAVALAVLARTKHRIAARVGSPALRADGWVSAVGSILAGVTLLGTGLAQAPSWAWADPAAATVVGAGAVLLSARLWRGARRTHPLG